MSGEVDRLRGREIGCPQKPGIITSHLSHFIMLTVHLSDLRFFSHHGAYDGEPETGGGFEVQLKVRYEEKKTKFDSLKNIVSYEDLFHIVKKRMSMPTPLLEAVAESIIGKIKHEYSFVQEVSVSIFKLHPPIEHFQGKAGITLVKKFDD